MRECTIEALARLWNGVKAKLDAAAPQWQTSGNWTWRVTENWLEAVYTATGQTIAVTNGSGAFYRSNAMTLTVPAAVRGDKTLNVKNVSVICGHSGYPVTTAVETLVANGITWFALSGSSRNSTGGYAITARIEGTLE